MSDIDAQSRIHEQGMSSPSLLPDKYVDLQETLDRSACTTRATQRKSFSRWQTTTQRSEMSTSGSTSSLGKSAVSGKEKARSQHNQPSSHRTRATERTASRRHSDRPLQPIGSVHSSIWSVGKKPLVILCDMNPEKVENSVSRAAATQNAAPSEVGRQFQNTAVSIGPNNPTHAAEQGCSSMQIRQQALNGGQKITLCLFSLSNDGDFNSNA